MDSNKKRFVKETVRSDIAKGAITVFSNHVHNTKDKNYQAMLVNEINAIKKALLGYNFGDVDVQEIYTQATPTAPEKSSGDSSENGKVKTNSAKMFNEINAACAAIEVKLKSSWDRIRLANSILVKIEDEDEKLVETNAEDSARIEKFEVLFNELFTNLASNVAAILPEENLIKQAEDVSEKVEAYRAWLEALESKDFKLRGRVFKLRDLFKEQHAEALKIKLEQLENYVKILKSLEYENLKNLIKQRIELVKAKDSKGKVAFGKAGETKIYITSIRNLFGTKDTVSKIDKNKKDLKKNVEIDVNKAIADTPVNIVNRKLLEAVMLELSKERAIELKKVIDTLNSAIKKKF